MARLLSLLRDAGVEPDQRVMRALEMCASGQFTDAHLFLALYHLNSTSTRLLKVDESRLRQEDTYRGRERVPPDQINFLTSSAGTAESVMREVLAEVRGRKSLGVRAFLRSICKQCIARGEDYPKRPYTADVLVSSAGLSDSAPLSEAQGLRELLSRLARTPADEEDFQYILALEGDRIAFRTVSVLGDYLQVSDSSLYVPQRALLTHFKDQYGGFTADEIEDLEELLNNPKAREHEFQRYFEKHANFFRRWDYREVYAQTYLSRLDAGPLVPDFILTNRDAQRAAILDLKLPKPTIVRRQPNRDRFTAAISEARAQLLRYRDWFREADNRRMLKSKVGMEIYEPHLMVIIGRSTEFQDEFDRQRLAADNPGIEVVTYDDMLSYANDRRIVIDTAV